MYEDVLYKKPFLKEVICRIDFPSPLPGIDKSLPNSLSKKVLQFFPIEETKSLEKQEFKFEGNKISKIMEESTRWDFHGREREKTLTLIPSSIFVKATEYKSFEPFIQEFQDVLDVLFAEYQGAFANRIGLRYVNIIDIDGDDPFDWEGHISKDLLGVIDFPADKKTIARAFNILELNFEGHVVKFQFGIANPDYPAVVKRKQFVLDIDSYFNGSFSLAEIRENFQSAHSKIQEVFEKSITDLTRGLMEPVSNG